MGTRADFYVGKGKDAEWLGSIAWDGHPESIPDTLRCATTEALFRAQVAKFFAGRDDVTTPDMGWPWPWEDSRLTDYSYAFADGSVSASAFGNQWFDAEGPEPEDDTGPKLDTFPDMSARKNVTFGKRSGLLILRAL